MTEDKRKHRVEYTNVNQQALDQRQSGTDFHGNLTEFQLTFDWRWDNPEDKVLYEKATDAPYSGTITIKDERLDEDTYPGQGQVVKFSEGRIKFFESLAEE